MCSWGPGQENSGWAREGNLCGALTSSSYPSPPSGTGIVPEPLQAQVVEWQGLAAARVPRDGAVDVVLAALPGSRPRQLGDVVQALLSPGSGASMAGPTRPGPGGVPPGPSPLPRRHRTAVPRGPAVPGSAAATHDRTGTCSR